MLALKSVIPSVLCNFLPPSKDIGSSFPVTKRNIELKLMLFKYLSILNYLNYFNP